MAEMSLAKSCQQEDLDCVFHVVVVPSEVTQCSTRSAGVWHKGQGYTGKVYVDTKAGVGNAILGYRRIELASCCRDNPWRC
jgi:hypothetical protein